MALRIGKKNNADDWSEEALRQELAQISNQTDDTTAQSAPDSEELLADFTADFPDESAVDALQPAAPSKPKVSPVLLAAGLVFLIVAGAVGIWLAFFSSPPEDEAPPPVIAKRPPRPAATNPKTPAKSPKTPPPATKVIGTPTPKTTPPSKVAPPRTPVKPTTPGKAGITSKAAKPPAVAPKTPQQAPRVVPVQGVPTPVVPPPGMAGQPGKGSTRIPTVRVVQPTVPLTPALQRRLKALWNQGAAAKHRGDYAGARRAWEEILRIRPGHPGIQEAIDKLPK